MGGEHPDWLPVGWRVSVKIRSFGRKDKYYINPSNGHTFNSKPEVLRYLKSSGKACKLKELNKIDIKKTVAEKLPPGWIKEIRTKKKGGKTRRDPYYIDPVSGRHFRSMPEAFRYLKSKNSGEAESKPDDKGHISVELGDHSQSSSAEAKGERLIDKKADKNLTGHESVKSGVEPILVPPPQHTYCLHKAPRLQLDLGVKGAAMNNVNMAEDNHLEQREDDSLAIELSGELQLVNRVKQHADKMMNIKKLADNKVDKSANVDQRLKSGPNVAALEQIEKPVLEQRDREDDSVAGNLPKKLPQANGKERRNGGRRQSRRLADSNLKDNVTKDQSLQSGSEAAAAEKNINIPENNGMEQREKENSCTGEGQQHQNLAHQNKRKTSNSKWTSNLPRRTSKRLTRLEVDPSMEVKTSNKGGDSAALSEGEVDTTKNVGKSGLSGETEIETTGKVGRLYDSNEHPSKCRKENPTNNKQEKPTTHENLSSLEGHKGVGVDCKEDQKHEKQLDSSLKDLLMDPCIEFAIKTLTGAIPIEDVNKVGDSPVSSLASPNQTSASSSVLPSGDIWSDPCFEFAVKTLTGEMPTEDGSQFQISFEKPLSSSGASGCNGLTLPKFRLDSVYPSNYSFSQFDAVKKPCMRQQGVMDPPFPQAINGSSQNSVDTGHHHGFEGRKGNFM